MSNRWRSMPAGFAAVLLAGAAIGALAHYVFSEFADAAGPPAATHATAADEQAIRATADEFAKAFNAGDAKTIGAQWAADAEYTDESGQEFHGRAAIETEYAVLFKEHPGATVSLKIEAIRFLGPDIALERGVATVKLPKSSAVSAAHYNVTHARRGGKWVMVVGRDSPYAGPSNEDHLKDFAWMIGEWKPEGKGRGLEIKSEWLAQHKFIKNIYTITTGEKETVSGAQIIGWSPRLAKIVAWHFDAQGGFGNDVWTKDGSKWVINATGTLGDGSESSAVNVISPIDANSFTWQSVKRTLDGVSLPDLGPVKIARVEAAK